MLREENGYDSASRKLCLAIIALKLNLAERILPWINDAGG
jgi:hypothetical protein